MIGFGRTQSSRNHFTVRSSVQLPRPPPPPMESDEDSEEEVVIRPKRSKRHRLPGARLLKQLAAERAKEKAERKHERRAKKDKRRYDDEDADIDEMTARLRRMFAED